MYLMRTKTNNPSLSIAESTLDIFFFLGFLDFREFGDFYVSYDGGPSYDHHRTPTLFSFVYAFLLRLRYSRRNDDRSFVGELRYSRRNDDRSFVGELSVVIPNT